MDEYSVVVAITSSTGDVWTYALPRVLDFSIDTRRDEPPHYRADPLRVPASDPPRSITFSMRPLPNDDGEYMRVEVHEAEE